MPIIKSMVLRLDSKLMAQLETRADAERLSREGYVRRLIAQALGAKSEVRAQGTWRKRFAEDTKDERVVLSRIKGKGRARLSR